MRGDQRCGGGRLGTGCGRGCGEMREWMRGDAGVVARRCGARRVCSALHPLAIGEDAFARGADHHQEQAPDGDESLDPGSALRVRGGLVPDDAFARGSEGVLEELPSLGSGAARIALGDVRADRPRRAKELTSDLPQQTIPPEHLRIRTRLPDRLEPQAVDLQSLERIPIPTWLILLELGCHAPTMALQDPSIIIVPPHATPASSRTRPRIPPRAARPRTAGHPASLFTPPHRCSLRG